MIERDRTYIDDRIEGYVKSLTAVLLAEIQELKSDMKDIKADVRRINGNVREVCEWKAGHQAVHDTREKSGASTLKLLGVVIAFLAMASGIFFGFASINKKFERTEYRIETLDNFQRMQERYLEYKFKETPIVPTTRGGVIKKDTINKK